MATLLEKVAILAKQRDETEQAFRNALVAARPACSWGELAQASGMSRNGIKYLVKEHTKGENMEQTENDVRDIERDRDLPPDEPYERPDEEEDDEGRYVTDSGEAA